MARTSILLTSSGAFVNPEQSLFPFSAIDGSTSTPSYFSNQITVEFFDGIVMQSNGVFQPDQTKVVKTGLSGTLQLKIWASEDSPYPVELEEDIIDVSTSCILLWTGIAEQIDVMATDIEGATYINVLLDRA